MKLDEIFPNGRGDGRKFTRHNFKADQYFEPFFRSAVSEYWFGLREDGTAEQWKTFMPDWSEWTEPKKIKKVTLWRYIVLYEGRYETASQWRSDKDSFDLDDLDIAGWESREVEVEE